MDPDGQLPLWLPLAFVQRGRFLRMYRCCPIPNLSLLTSTEGSAKGETQLIEKDAT